ncbi:YihY/virulence factor BrkB family protein [Actinoplanes awajinensis]|uniref:YihY/virulence factor BrkB family protein n=1 Tax=Actinoplanes awajinensis TaxID=135946 RepID=UPI000A4D989F|nr:YhjD/YihY/BrkB family envelope integrity protein [Actinoplanes awajinensis]
MIRGLDDWQRRHRVPGFGYAVLRKYLDDGGPREAALITYYGFLSLFPVLLLGVTIVSQILADRPELRREVVDAIVPVPLRADVDAAIAGMPTSYAALALGVAGLAYAAAGVVLSAHQTLNHLAAVPYRDRSGLVSRYLRVLAALAALLAGIVLVATLPAVGALAGAFVVLLLVAWVLLDRPAPLRSLWPAALLGAGAVILLVQLGAVLLPGLIRRAGPVYGGFATVAGLFTLLYLLSNMLVGAAEVAAVRHARLWPRGLDPARPTEADRHAQELLTREQARS